MTNTESHTLADHAVIIEFKSLNQTKKYIDHVWSKVCIALDGVSDAEKAMVEETKYRVKNFKNESFPDRGRWAKSACLENALNGATFNSRADQMWGLNKDFMTVFAMGAFFRDRIFKVISENPDINFDNLVNARKIMCGLKKL